MFSGYGRNFADEQEDITIGKKINFEMSIPVLNSSVRPRNLKPILASGLNELS